METRPRRRPARLAGYDYSQAGVYFVTICTARRICCLSCIETTDRVGALHEAPAVRLTGIGQIVEQVILSLPSRYPALGIKKYVIMPNHVHLLLQIGPPEDRAHRDAPLRAAAEEGKQKRRALLAQVVGYLKMNVSKQVHQTQPQLVLWQSRYYDHIVRDEGDFLRIWQYIDTNPAKWAQDEYYIP